MQHIVTFGEIMARLMPEGYLKLRQALPGKLNVTFGGAEANVAVSLAYMGAPATFVSALPKNELANACIASLNSLQVNTRFITRTKKGRLGLYFVEAGANQRPSKVVYDRHGSAIALTPPEEYPWKDIFNNAKWFHLSGITPALSQAAADAALSAVKAAKNAKLTVSCDLNFRKKLWLWDSNYSQQELAENTMRQLLPFVDVVLANEEDTQKVLGIRADHTDVEAGQLAIHKYPDVAREVTRQYPNVSKVAITLRQSISASHNNWAAMLYDATKKEAFFAPCQNSTCQPYQINHIVDRVGGGDAFAAGLIFALTTPDLNLPQTAIAYATAASCLAHSIPGDFNLTTRSEIESLMKGSQSGRIVR